MAHLTFSKAVSQIYKVTNILTFLQFPGGIAGIAIGVAILGILIGVIVGMFFFRVSETHALTLYIFYTFTAPF